MTRHEPSNPRPAICLRSPAGKGIDLHEENLAVEGLGATKPRSTVSLAAEAETPGAFGRNVSGFGLAERVCLRSDFAGATG